MCKEESNDMFNIFNDMFNEDENYRRVRDHCHYTGKPVGAAQSICNMRYITSK